MCHCLSLRLILTGLINGSISCIAISFFFILNLFQFPQMAFNRYLLNGSFSWTIIFKFKPKFSVRFRSKLFVCLFLKSFNLLCFATIRIIVPGIHLITKVIFFQWNEKIILDFNVSICFGYWGNNSHLRRSLDDTNLHTVNDLVNSIIFIMQLALYVSF